MNLPSEGTEKSSTGYELAHCAPRGLTPDELEQCITLIGSGGAVNRNTMKRDLPNATVLAVARCDGKIVAVGAIKPVRKQYAAGIAANSDHAFPDDTPELGYVAVDGKDTVCHIALPNSCFPGTVADCSRPLIVLG